MLRILTNENKLFTNNLKQIKLLSRMVLKPVSPVIFVWQFSNYHHELFTRKASLYPGEGK